MPTFTRNAIYNSCQLLAEVSEIADLNTRSFRRQTYRAEILDPNNSNRIIQKARRLIYDVLKKRIDFNVPTAYVNAVEETIRYDGIDFEKYNEFNRTILNLFRSVFECARTFSNKDKTGFLNAICDSIIILNTSYSNTVDEDRRDAYHRFADYVSRNIESLKVQVNAAIHLENIEKSACTARFVDFVDAAFKRLIQSFPNLPWSNAYDEELQKEYISSFEFVCLRLRSFYKEICVPYRRRLQRSVKIVLTRTLPLNGRYDTRGIVKDLHMRLINDDEGTLLPEPQMIFLRANLNTSVYFPPEKDQASVLWRLAVDSYYPLIEGDSVSGAFAMLRKQMQDLASNQDSDYANIDLSSVAISAVLKPNGYLSSVANISAKIKAALDPNIGVNIFVISRDQIPEPDREPGILHFDFADFEVYDLPNDCGRGNCYQCVDNRNFYLVLADSLQEAAKIIRTLQSSAFVLRRDELKRCANFIGRKKEFERVNELLALKQGAVGFHAPMGCGKTAFMTEVAFQYASNDCLIIHDVPIWNTSRSAGSVIDNLTRQIASLFRIDPDATIFNSGDECDRLRKIVEKVSSARGKRKVLVLIDACDAIRNAGRDLLTRLTEAFERNPLFEGFYLVVASREFKFPFADGDRNRYIELGDNGTDELSFLRDVNEKYHFMIDDSVFESIDRLIKEDIQSNIRKSLVFSTLIRNVAKLQEFAEANSQSPSTDGETPIPPEIAKLRKSIDSWILAPDVDVKKLFDAEYKSARMINVAWGSCLSYYIAVFWSLLCQTKIKPVFELLKVVFERSEFQIPYDVLKDLSRKTESIEPNLGKTNYDSFSSNWSNLIGYKRILTDYLTANHCNDWAQATKMLAQFCNSYRWLQEDRKINAYGYALTYRIEHNVEYASQTLVGNQDLLRVFADCEFIGLSAKANGFDSILQACDDASERLRNKAASEENAQKGNWETWKYYATFWSRWSELLRSYYDENDAFDPVRNREADADKIAMIYAGFISDAPLLSSELISSLPYNLREQYESDVSLLKDAAARRLKR